ncbi:MAG TPA: hypothetical protein VK172_10260 [Lentimicrobium sp.]|nr:hypothetical protein [Lentimicrobium sp.]
MTNFEERKAKILKDVENLLDDYDAFTKSVSPKHWRTTGHHCAELRKIKDEIPELTQITEAEYKNGREKGFIDYTLNF